MIIVRFDAALYIRTSWFYSNLDKVVRLRVAAGQPVDFISEHIIYAGASQIGTGSAYGQATIIPRNGSDEAPPALIDGDWHGGNHTGVSHYTLGIFLDGKTITATRGDWAGNTLTLIESYVIPTDAAIASSQPDPARAVIYIERKFGSDGFCRYKYSITAMRQLTLSELTTMQIYRPTVKVGQTLHLIVPGSNLSGGVNITNENTERFLPVSDWTDPNVPPAYFVKEIRQSGVPQFAIAMGFDPGLNRGVLTTACYRSTAGKFYPRAFEGPVTMVAGEKREFSGFFGSYNRLGN